MTPTATAPKKSKPKAVPVEVMPPISMAIFPPQKRSWVGHADIFLGFVFHWVCLLLSLVCFAACTGVVVGACLVALPGLALFGIGWFLQRTANRTR